MQPASMPPHSALPSTIGRFRIDGLIGAGGMGEVYKGFDPTLQRVVALKTVRSDIHDHDFLARLYREAQACARLRHPNIVTIHEAGESNGLVYLVMEFLQGDDLRALLSRCALTLLERIEVLCQVLSALQHTHAEGVIHRDIKPSNVHRGLDGTIKLVDFGLAQIATASPLTRTGTALCTPAYASPEQLRDESLDARTDIYSTGALGYELLAGRPPFVSDGGNVGALILRALTEPPPPMAAAWSRVVPELEQSIAKAMAKAPADRYQTAADMRQALLAVVATSRDAILAEQARQEAAGRTAASAATTLLGQARREEAEALLEQTLAVNPDARDARALLTHSRRYRWAAPATVPAVPGDSDLSSAAWRIAAPAQKVSATPSLERTSDGLTAEVAGRRSRPAVFGGLAASGLLAASLWLAADRGSPTALPADGGAAPPQPTSPATVSPAEAKPQAGDTSRSDAPVVGPDSGSGAPEATVAPSRNAYAGPPIATGPLPSATTPRSPSASHTTTAKELFSPTQAGALAVAPGLRYRVTRRGADGTEGDVDDESTTFHSGDRVRFTFESNVDGFLYVVQQGSSGRWTVLLPGPSINGGRNTISKGQSYQVPTEDWFLFDDTPGTEQVFVFFSREPMKHLPGFDRPVARYETLAASVVDDLKRRVQSRDLLFEKDRPVATAGGAVQSTYVVNKAELADAVAASIALVHAR